MLTALLLSLLAFSPDPVVTVERVPDGGIQPQVIQDDSGISHLLSYSGDARNGDLMYSRSSDGKAWSKAVRVNREPGNAIAMGTIRGGQIAVANGRVHVVWNGSKGKPAEGAHAAMAQKHGTTANEMPLLYTRSKPDGTFEPEKNLLGNTRSLDGGASVAADPRGGVFVVWHAAMGAAASEGDRKVWLARSADSGATFEKERSMWNEPTGACACCGLKALAADGTLWVAYRSAKEDVNRDSYLLKSVDNGKSFTGEIVSRWKVSTCPMSSYWLEPSGKGLVMGMEEQGAVRFTKGSSGPQIRLTPSVERAPAKYPTAATNNQGVTLFVWTEGTGWNRGGSVVWKALDAAGRPVPGLDGRRDGVPAWSFAAALTRKDGSFTILY